MKRKRAGRWLAVVAAALAGCPAVGDRPAAAASDGARGRSRAPGAAVRPRDGPAHHDPPRRAAAPFCAAPSPAGPRPRPAWRVERRATPAADDAAVEDLLGGRRPRGERARPPTSRPSGRAGAARPSALELDEPRRPVALGAARAARRGGAGRVRARRRRGRRFASAPRACSSWPIATPAAFRDRRLFPLDRRRGDVDRLARARAAAEASCAPSTGAGRTGTSEWVAERARRREPAPPARAARRALRRRRPAPRGRRRESLTMAARRDGSRSMPATVRRADRRRSNAAAPARGACVPADGAASGVARRWPRRRAPDVRLLSQPPDTVTRIELADDRGARRSCGASDGAWRFDDAEGGLRGRPARVDDWLARLGAVRTATRAAIGRQRPRHLIVDGRFRQEVDVSSRRPTWLRAARARSAALPRARGAVFARFDVRRAAALRPAARPSSSPRDDGDTWRAPRRRGADVDRGQRRARRRRAVGNLRAEEFVAAPPAGDARSSRLAGRRPAARRDRRRAGTCVAALAAQRRLRRADADAFNRSARLATAPRLERRQPCDALRLGRLPEAAEARR